MLRTGAGLLALLLATAPGVDARASIVYDLAGDWGDAANPNGVWSYNGQPGTPLANHLADYDPNHQYFAAPQPAYAFNTIFTGPAPFADGIPSFYKAVSARLNAADDQPLGHVYLHNNDPFNSPSGYEDQPAEVSWTAPNAGQIVIAGDLWEVERYRDRTMDWALLVNGVIVSDGVLTPLNATSGAPLDFGTGSGGAAALSRPVSAGDVISFQLSRHASESFGTFVGLDLRIQLTAAPEPSTLASCGLACLMGLGFVVRRRKAS